MHTVEGKQQCTQLRANSTVQYLLVDVGEVVSGDLVGVLKLEEAVAAVACEV